MPGLEIHNASKKYGAVTAVKDVNLHFNTGDMVCFLGPSGCGKTTLLRMIAGLESLTEGRVVFEGKDLTDVPVHLRDIGMVFQSFALFPHLSVGENISYAMRIRSRSRAERQKRVRELLDMIHLPGIEDRRISQLSGGQRQRVAIARALALNPQIFLLDEPMSALDANLRESMQIELRKLQQQLGITTIVVTHDQTEAMTMADEIVVMATAEVQQTGKPMEIYKKPANRFVADFIGTSNLLPGKLTALDEVRIGENKIKVAQTAEGVKPGQDILLLTRPEEVLVHANPVASGGENTISGKVSFIRDIGSTIEILVDCDGHEMISVMTPKDWPDVKEGMDVLVEVPAPACTALAV